MKEYKEYRGIYFPEGTDESVKQIVASAYRSKDRLRFWYGDTTTGVTWNEEYCVFGYIGRSTGNIKIPLLINNRRSYGGMELMADRILRIDRTDTHQTLYQHPRYDNGVWTIEADHTEGFTCCVKRDGELIARFDTELKAAKYIDFMNGKRYAK